MANLGDACTHEELLSIYENGYTILRVRRLCIVVLCHPEADGAMGVHPRAAPRRAGNHPARAVRGGEADHPVRSGQRSHGGKIISTHSCTYYVENP